jgi:hypothetical protein
MKTWLWMCVTALCLTATRVPAEELMPETTPVEPPAPVEEIAAAVEPTPEPAPRAPVFAVMLPERVDHAWYWLLYTEQSQHIVQTAVEKALVRAGLDVVDLSTATLPAHGGDWQRLLSVAFAQEAGRALAADYIVTGQATAVQASSGSAYGVTVVRSQAEISARIVRVSDGKILAIEDASALEGGQAAQAAGQAALKKAGAQVASKIARAARALPAPEATPAP